MSSYGEHIRAFRKSKGLNQSELGKIAHVSTSAVSQWETNDNEPSIGNIELIARHFGVAKSEILGDMPTTDLPPGAIRPVIAETVMVPLYGTIAAGEELEMCPTEDEYPMFKEMADKYPKGFLLKINGESMNKVLPNGSYAYIDPKADLVSGKVYAVNVNGYDATVKRVRVLNNGIELIPDSTDPTYEPKIYDYGKPDTEDIRIIGRLVWVVYPFDYIF